MAENDDSNRYTKAASYGMQATTKAATGAANYANPALALIGSLFLADVAPVAR